MSRLLLLIPSTSYRVSDFLAAAERVGVEVTVGSDEKQVLEEFSQGGTTTIDFKNIDVGTDQIIAFNRHYTVAAIIAVDEVTGVLAAKASDRLGLPHNDWTAIATTGNKLDMREKLAVAGLPSPKFQFFSIDDNPEKISHRIDYPCVLKPLNLSASRGVIRSNNSSEFVSAFNRIQRLLAGISKTASDVVLVEDYIEGEEVALEGLLENGRLTTLALFDKPDPLEGPYFEETLYVTPSRHDTQTQESIRAMTEQAAAAIGLTEGPIHAELRVLDTDRFANEKGPWIVELAARSIGGLCSRSLSFGEGLSLEEIILRHALSMPILNKERENIASGVMMIPIPAAGVVRKVTGLNEARGVDGILDITIGIPMGREVTPIPEGDQYLGFIFAKAETPESVEKALREAHKLIAFTIEPSPGTG